MPERKMPKKKLENMGWLDKKFQLSDNELPTTTKCKG